MFVHHKFDQKLEKEQVHVTVNPASWIRVDYDAADFIAANGSENFSQTVDIGEDEHTARVAHSIEEDKQLIEAGFVFHRKRQFRNLQKTQVNPSKSVGGLLESAGVDLNPSEHGEITRNPSVFSLLIFHEEQSVWEKSYGNPLRYVIYTDP
ncbi:MAG: hypothetical protein ACUVTB_07090 [Candidatus Bathycorpusculaceae bacterium]